MLGIGLDVEDDLLALASASHDGELFHQDGVRCMLSGCGLDESSLQTPLAWPSDESTMHAMIRDGRGMSSVAMNCSGKHAAMLRTAVRNGWSTVDYRNPEHLVQVAIRRAVEELAGEQTTNVGVDGCGAPLFAISLVALARAFGRLAAATSGPEATVSNAIRRHPEYASGTHRDECALHRALPGVVAKAGAEAVYAVGLPDGRGVAIKVSDGYPRAQSVLMAGVLRSLGFQHDVLTAQSSAPYSGTVNVWERSARSQIFGRFSASEHVGARLTGDSVQSGLLGAVRVAALQRWVARLSGGARHTVVARVHVFATSTPRLRHRRRLTCQSSTGQDRRGRRRAGERGMGRAAVKIRSADVVVCSPGRNYVTLIIRTDDGLVGVGDATVNGRELAVASYLRDHVVALLPGRDAHAVEDTWQYLYRGAYWRRGPITMAAIAAVDVALWDLKAQAAGLPLYELLGGRSRKWIRAYGHAHGRDLAELVDSVHARAAQGFSAVRVQVGVPGFGRGYGVAPSADAGRYEPAVAGDQPVEEIWDSRRYLRHLPTVFEELRHVFGAELDLLHDVHHRLTPIEAARLGRSLEPYDPFWLEDVTPAENQESFRVVREHTTVPLATGETFNSVVDYLQLVPEQLIDYVRSAVTHAGGVTGLRRILDFAALYQIKSAIHGPTDISPIGLAAALHIDTVHHAFGIQEFMQHEDPIFEVFDVDYRFVDGAFQPGERPGVGVRFDEAAAQRFPYRRAYLPVNRLVDGTVHDW